MHNFSYDILDLVDPNNYTGRPFVELCDDPSFLYIGKNNKTVAVLSLITFSALSDMDISAFKGGRFAYVNIDIDVQLIINRTDN